MYSYICKTDDPTQILVEGTLSSDVSVPDGYKLVTGRPPENASQIPVNDPVIQINQLVSKAQETLNSSPLPDDIQFDICQLLAALPIAVNHSMWGAARSAATKFTIDPTRTDVSDAQKSAIDTFKNQILAVLNGA